MCRLHQVYSVEKVLYVYIHTILKGEVSLRADFITCGVKVALQYSRLTQR